MKALITGGAGFIGSHLARSLCAAGNRVTIIDDLSSGSLVNLRWRMPGHSLEFVEGTVVDGAQLRRLVENIDVVFHLAARPAAGMTTARAVDAQPFNLDATLGLLQLCGEAGVKKVIFASTAAVYGSTATSPVRESEAVAPETPYAVQKFASECYARLFSQSGLATVSLRLSNVYGPGQSFSSPYSGIVAQFCTAFVNDEKPVLGGGGAPSTDFIFIADAVQAFELAAAAPVEKVAGRVFNVGSGRTVNLLDLLNILKELSGKELGADFLPVTPDYLWSPALDISEASKVLGYNPSVGLSHGVWETFEFYQQLCDAIPAI